MLAVIGTALLTWLFLGLITYICSGDLSYRQSIGHGGVGLLMLIFGWVPSLVVAIDLDSKLS